ncbi:hypothetical protein T4D_15140 [Trichinella pseudospiralis]|uniref:Uncharacterized protein n=1 Tax=Trichinella pseudospiralis TaxID=6337 RepID=A0A0V1FJ26_TRIPS|nr:hypothetical protein T4D_15140 [Trichinella pseudospiralis]
MKKRKSENADDTKQIADDTKQIEDDTKQNCGMKTYGICGSPRVPIFYVRWSVTFGAQSEVSEDTLDGEDAICPSRV